MGAGAAHPVVALAGEWTDAWNACDAERIVRTVHEDFRMYRRKGDVVGVDGLRKTLERQTYGVAMKIWPRALYGRGDRFAMTARVEYRSVEDDELVGAEDGGIALDVRDGLILSASPLGPDEALAAAGLTTGDVIFEWRERPA